MPPLSRYLKDYAGIIPAYLFGDAFGRAATYSPEPSFLTVHVPESFRGGCSFGAGVPVSPIRIIKECQLNPAT